MKGVLDIEEKGSILDCDGRVYTWCLYIDGENSPWIEDGTGYDTKKKASSAGRKWAKKLGVEIKEETFRVTK